MFIWCKCPLMGMSWMRMPICRYAMNVNARLGMQWMPMPAWVCNECQCFFGSMPWCEYPFGSMPWCKCPIGACHDANASCGYAMMRMLWCKHNLFKNSLYFQNKASTTPETKIFSKLDLLFMKSHLPFGLRLPKKNWWSLLENPRMGHRLGIWWSGSKDS